MRVFKFRAYTKQGMIYDLGVNPGEHDEFTMQFTGLKDKNGKEIYEGDLVKNGDHRVPEIIVFGECDYDSGEYIAGIQSCFGLKDHRFNGQEAIDSFTLKRLEVVGNIHENPELLK